MQYQLNSQSWDLFQSLLQYSNEFQYIESKVKGSHILNFLDDFQDEIGVLVVKTQLSNSAQISITKLKDSDFRQLFIKLIPSVPPAIITLGSQFPGWRIQIKIPRKEFMTFTGIASGPGRYLSQEPKKIFRLLKYSERDAKRAVLIIETISLSLPDDFLKPLILFLSRKCNVLPKNLGVILISSNNNVGSILGAARVIEMAIYRAIQEGFPPQSIVNASGTAPITTNLKTKTPVEAAAMIIDAITYGGKVELEVQGISDQFIEKRLSKLISSYSTNFGKLMITNLQDATDPGEIDIFLLAPSVISIKNLNSGQKHQIGEVFQEKLTQILDNTK